MHFCIISTFLIYKDFIYLFLERGEGRETERKRNIVVWEIDYLSHTPNPGPGPQPRHVSWLGIEPATFKFSGLHSVHWATPARAVISTLQRNPSKQWRREQLLKEDE